MIGQFVTLLSLECASLVVIGPIPVQYLYMNWDSNIAWNPLYFA